MWATFIFSTRFAPRPLFPLVRPFRSSDLISDPKTLRAVKRDSSSREIGKRFEAATFPTRSDKTTAPPHDRASIHYRAANPREGKEARRKSTAKAKGDGRWMMFPCRKLHYFIHAMPRRDWRKHRTPRHGQFPYAKRRSDVEQSRNRADSPCSFSSVRLLRLIRSCGMAAEHVLFPIISEGRIARYWPLTFSPRATLSVKNIPLYR